MVYKANYIKQSKILALGLKILNWPALAATTVHGKAAKKQKKTKAINKRKQNIITNIAYFRQHWWANLVQKEDKTDKLCNYCNIW